MSNTTPYELKKENAKNMFYELEYIHSDISSLISKKRCNVMSVITSVQLLCYPA